MLTSCSLRLCCQLCRPLSLGPGRRPASSSSPSSSAPQPQPEDASPVRVSAPDLNSPPVIFLQRYNRLVDTIHVREVHEEEEEDPLRTRKDTVPALERATGRPLTHDQDLVPPSVRKVRFILKTLQVRHPH